MSSNYKTRIGLTGILVSAVTVINAFITYLLTMAPDVPFWDCGEFIACSYTLGVAHPPGTPLFLLIGRLFIIFNPFFENLAARVNFVSVVASALAVGLTSIIIIKIFRLWFREKSERMPYNLLTYLGAIAGGLYMTYSSTFWFSAVEAEVYGVAMLLMQISVLLSLMWFERIGKPGSWRFLLLIVYLAFLSISIHMTVFLVMPAIYLFILYSDKNLLKDWRFWALGIVLMLVAVSLEPFLAASLILVLIGLYFTVIAKKRGLWALVTASVLLAVMGFSVHAYIPIRAAADPYIDMNDPETLHRFNYFMERKQYGEKSMLLSVFDRKGSWENQFGDYHRMGFWYYFKNQYSSSNLVFIPFLIGLYGIVAALRREIKTGGLLGLLLLVCTVGLVLYMNFSDGTKGVRLEVRDRDYFFTPGFMYFAMFIGIGASALGAWIYEKLITSDRVGKVVCLIPAVAMIALSIFHTAPSHWNEADRTGDYVPADYAYNMLNSCEKDAILFTNGDNDTYPLWYLQLVDSIRTDVRVVNLSLLNTDWYILQQKNQWGVPIPLNDDQIRWNIFKDRHGNTRMKPSKPYTDPVTGQLRYLSPNEIRVQTEMVRLITIANNWRNPIYLATTVGEDIRAVVGKYLRRDGLVNRITPHEYNGSFDIEVSDSLLKKVYSYRNLDNPDVHLGITSLSMSITYPEMFISLSDQVLAEGDTIEAINYLEKAIDIFPFYYRAPLKLNNIYMKQVKFSRGQKCLLESIERIEPVARENDFNILWPLFLGPLYMQTNQIDKAVKAFEWAYKIDANEIMALGSMVTAYQRAGQNEKAIRLLERWRKKFPKDAQVQQIYSTYMPMLRRSRPPSP